MGIPFLGSYTVCENHFQEYAIRKNGENLLFLIKLGANTSSNFSFTFNTRCWRIKSNSKWRYVQIVFKSCDLYLNNGTLTLRTTITDARCTILLPVIDCILLNPLKDIHFPTEFPVKKHLKTKEKIYR